MDIKLFNTEEEVNAYLGITPVAVPDLSWVQPNNRDAILAVNALFNIHEAHNKANNFVPDYADDDQYKYEVLQYIEPDGNDPSGFGVSLTYYAYWNTCSVVGSRLVVGTSKEAIHIGKTFKQLYIDWFISKK